MAKRSFFLDAPRINAIVRMWSQGLPQASSRESVYSSSSHLASL